jgi:hypothetical protein
MQVLSGSGISPDLLALLVSKIKMGYKLPKTGKIDPVEPPCKKTIYYSPEEAQDMIKYLKENRTDKTISAYKCTICGFWHLTSKSGK